MPEPDVPEPDVPEPYVPEPDVPDGIPEPDVPELDPVVPLVPGLDVPEPDVEGPDVPGAVDRGSAEPLGDSVPTFAFAMRLQSSKSSDVGVLDWALASPHRAARLAVATMADVSVRCGIPAPPRDDCRCSGYHDKEFKSGASESDLPGMAGCSGRPPDRTRPRRTGVYSPHLAAMKATILHTEASVGFGGQEVRILAETRWLLDHGWPAMIAAQPASRLLAGAGAAGIPARAVAMSHAASVPALLRLRRLMGNEGIGLVHTHSSVDSWVGTLAARSRGLPVVRSRHVSIPIRKGRALIYRLPDRVITSGSTVKAMLEDTGVNPERVVAIPAGIDAERF